MEKMISRTAAINEVERAKVRVSHSVERAIARGVIEIVDDIGKSIAGLPVTEQKTGKWILKNDHPVYGPGRKCVCCSACGWAAFQDTRLGQRVILNDEFHFCPQCGARMEGEQNG